jgi:hypothetical protein
VCHSSNSEYQFPLTDSYKTYLLYPSSIATFFQLIHTSLLIRSLKFGLSIHIQAPLRANVEFQTAQNQHRLISKQNVFHIAFSLNTQQFELQQIWMNGGFDQLESTFPPLENPL